MPIPDFAMQLARLRRHADMALANKDAIAFLDLAHSLRIWTDDNVKAELDRVLSECGMMPTFENPVIHRKLYKKAANGAYFCHIHFLPLADFRGGMIGEMSFINRHTDDMAMTLMSAGPPRVEKVQTTFCKWLATEIAIFGNLPPTGSTPERTIFGTSVPTSTEVRLGVSREMLINRVANVLGGSHADFADEAYIGNKYDPCIRALHEVQVNRYPITYYALLGFAYVISDLLEPVFGALRPER